MTNCPPRLRGDLSKWLCEISVGVYVGKISGRVRDAVWYRICENLKNGSATMVYSCNNEQGMDFRVHNTAWIPVEYDGIKLMRRPLPGIQDKPSTLKPGFSSAAKRQISLKKRAASARKTAGYVVIDLETSGLNPAADCIIEYAAVRVVDGQQQEFSTLVNQNVKLSDEIVKITGITNEMLCVKGVAPKQALEEFLNFIGNDRIVGQNVSFDIDFLLAACRENKLTEPANKCTDLISVARRKLDDIQNYKLATLAKYFSVPIAGQHRALADCKIAQAVYEKLNEI